MGAEETYDYIVVGAGPAGCAVATRLAIGQPKSTIALIEAGPAKIPFSSDLPADLGTLVAVPNAYNYGYTTIPQPQLNGRRGYQPRGRGVGGSSLINAMVFIRGQREDYDQWAAQGCPGWAFADVLPYFKKLEDNERGADAYHGTGGPLHVSDLRSRNPITAAFVRACVEAGIPENKDFNGAVQDGAGIYQVYQKNGRRCSAGKAYLPLARGKHLNLIADTQVRQILIEGGRATGVACGPANAKKVLRARNEVILSAGAFGTPQLLMVSGIGPGDHLRALNIPVQADVPGVGGNLQDHLDYTLSVEVDNPALMVRRTSRIPQQVLGLLQFLLSGSGMLTTNIAEAGAFLKSDPGLSRPDLQYHFCVALVDDHGRKSGTACGMTLHVCHLQPKSRGTVRLASPLIEGAPLIDTAFLSAPSDLDALVRGVEIGQRIMAAPSLKRLGGKFRYGTGADEPDKIAELIRAHADTIYHPVGTCRMGSDAGAVVDPELKLRRIGGLRVVDASIMPTLVSGNTEACSAMIGEKAADMILKSAKS
jgi:choline dehydrogenase-like flavoprotein